MGLMDAINAEDRIQVTRSEYRDLVEGTEQGRILKNAVYAEIPYDQIKKILTEENDELEEYRKSGLNPEQIQEIDQLYRKKCEEVISLKTDLDKMKKRMEEIRGLIVTQEEGEKNDG